MGADILYPEKGGIAKGMNRSTHRGSQRLELAAQHCVPRIDDMSTKKTYLQ